MREESGERAFEVFSFAAEKRMLQELYATTDSTTKYRLSKVI
jgi:hypothetical protein